MNPIYDIDIYDLNYDWALTIARLLHEHRAGRVVIRRWHSWDSPDSFDHLVYNPETDTLEAV